MKVLITGATGLIGKKITQKLLSRGDEVIILTRSAHQAKKSIPNAADYREWNEDLLLKKEIEIDAVINLAGENVMARRWNDTHKKKVLESRINSTKNLIEFISALETKPKVFISASAIGIYGNENSVVDENSSTANDFLANVVKEWEAESSKIDALDIRRVNVRIGIVLDKNEGALAKMITPFKFFVGGAIGCGKQWFSWIHADDIAGIFLFALDNQSVNGAVNGTAPNPVSMNEFAATLGKIMRRPSLFNVSAFVLKLVLGEGAEAVLGGTKVNSEKIKMLGYKFKFENLYKALEDLLIKQVTQTS